MTDAELFMKMRASFKEAEAFVEAVADRFEAQAAEIERLKTQCEGLFQAAMNNGQALIIAEAKLEKAMDEALEILDDEGWLGKTRERIELLKTGAKP